AAVRGDRGRELVDLRLYELDRVAADGPADVELQHQHHSVRGIDGRRIGEAHDDRPGTFGADPGHRAGGGAAWDHRGGRQRTGVERHLNVQRGERGVSTDVDRYQQLVPRRAPRRPCPYARLRRLHYLDQRRGRLRPVARAVAEQDALEVLAAGLGGSRV